jgi:hypothetical protein
MDSNQGLDVNLPKELLENLRKIIFSYLSFNFDDIAKSCNNAEMIGFLYEFDIDGNFRKKIDDLINRAAEKDYVEILKCLFGNIYCFEMWSQSALNTAVRSGSIHVVEYLIGEGINVSDHTLHIDATREENAERIGDLLLEAEENLEEKYIKILKRACYSDKLDILKRLEQKIDITNDKGELLKIAKMYGSDKIVDYLEKDIAKKPEQNEDTEEHKKSKPSVSQNISGIVEKSVYNVNEIKTKFQEHIKNGRYEEALHLRRSIRNLGRTSEAPEVWWGLLNDFEKTADDHVRGLEEKFKKACEDGRPAYVKELLKEMLYCQDSLNTVRVDIEALKIYAEKRKIELE